MERTNTCRQHDSSRLRAELSVGLTVKLARGRAGPCALPPYDLSCPYIFIERAETNITPQPLQKLVVDTVVVEFHNLVDFGLLIEPRMRALA